MSMFRRAVPVLFVPFVAVRLLAQPSAPEPEDGPLAALVEEALAKNPDVQEADEAVTAARARPDQARALPDPTLSFNYTNDGWSPTLGARDMTTFGVMGSQVLTWPGKRRLRGAVSALEADQASLRAERMRRSVAASVKRAYLGLVLAQQLQVLIHEQEEIWKEIEGVARARYGVGQGAQQDVLRVQVEVTRIQQLRAEELAEERVRRAELNRLLARAADQPILTANPLALVKDLRSRDETLAQVEQASPELRAASAAIEQNRLLVDLVEKEARPDLAVQAGYMNRGGLDPMWQAGVAFNLPLRRRRLQGARAEAEARTRGSERRLDSLRLELRFRTEERLAQRDAAETLSRLYGDGIVPQDQMSVEAAVANYHAGKVPFVAVLEALATLYVDRSTHLRVLVGQERIRVSLEEASLDPTSDLPAAGPMGARAAALVGGSASAAGAMTGMAK
jgi:cobalt-zinc-cadmium efflux system outer membrane protein